jgi:hypothetical protein
MSPTSDRIYWDRLFSYVNGGVAGRRERDWSYCGLDIWPIVKAQILMRGSNIFNAGRQMSLAKAESAARPQKNALLKWFAAGVTAKSAAPPTPKNPPTPKKVPDFKWPELPEAAGSVDVLCLGYATNHKKIGSGYFQLCMDPLRQALTDAGVESACLIAGMDETHEGIVQASALAVHGIEKQFRAVRALAKQMAPVELASFQGFEDWWEGLSEVLDGQMFVTVEHIESVIQQTAVAGHWLRHCLGRAKPKAVLVSSYYGLMGHGGSWACRQLGIPIADVQHGVAGSTHHAYSWPNAPRDGFNTLPTAFFTWSEQECADMRRTSGEWTPGLLAVGNVWRLLDESLAHGESPRIFRSGAIRTARKELKNDRAAIRTIKDRTYGNKDILVALHPDEPLPWFGALRRLCPREWRFWVRLHPGEFKNNEALAERLREIVDDRTFVIEPSKAPLNVILSEVDVVLTKFSSVALDARAYGVPTVAYSDVARVFFGNPEMHRVRYVALYPETIKSALVQRLSSYRSVDTEKMAIDRFEVLGRKAMDTLHVSAMAV